VRRGNTGLVAGLLGALSGISGCADTGSFELVDVDFGDDRSLVLTFSQPLASVDGVDPEAFRISLARARTELTQYYEPGQFGLVEDCLEECFFDDIIQEEICEQACPGDPAEITVATLDNAEHDYRIVLELSNAIGKPQCDWIDQSRDDNWEAGFTVAYDGDREPPVRSTSGQRLDSIMAHWVDGPDFEEVDDRFPSGTPVTPIPCPR
jgi:hypothetical protein